MKYLHLIFVFLTQICIAQSGVEPKVVMAVNKGDSINQRWMVRQLYNLKKAMPEASIEVVCYGSGLEALISKSCIVEKDIQQLISDGIIFAACENSMAGLGISKTELVPQCSTVKAGIAELVIRQSQGWQYVYGSR